MKNFEAELQKALAQYRRQLAKEAHTLRTLRDKVPEEPAAREQLQDFLHRLCGTAGTYEFTQLSDAARTLERRLLAGVDPHELDSDIDELVQMLHAAGIAEES